MTDNLSFTRLDYLLWRVVHKIAKRRPGREASTKSVRAMTAASAAKAPQHRRKREGGQTIVPQSEQELGDPDSDDDMDRVRHYDLHRRHAAANTPGSEAQSKPKSPAERTALRKETASAVKTWEVGELRSPLDASADAIPAADEWG